jgi:hypothetical protein
VSQLSKWSKQEGWDERLAAIKERVGDKMGLTKMKEDQAIQLASVEEQAHLLRLKELAIMGMEAIEEGEVEFTTMGEVLRAQELYAKERRLVEGEPTERRETRVNISLGGEGRTPIKAISALLAIAGDTENLFDDEEDEVIDVTPEN